MLPPTALVTVQGARRPVSKPPFWMTGLPQDADADAVAAEETEEEINVVAGEDTEEETNVVAGEDTEEETKVVAGEETEEETNVVADEDTGTTATAKVSASASFLHGKSSSNETAQTGNREPFPLKHVS